jgi:hypothetical protein
VNTLLSFRASEKHELTGSPTAITLIPSVSYPVRFVHFSFKAPSMECVPHLVDFRLLGAIGGGEGNEIEISKWSGSGICSSS